MTIGINGGKKESRNKKRLKAGKCKKLNTLHAMRVVAGARVMAERAKHVWGEATSMAETKPGILIAKKSAPARRRQNSLHHKKFA
jgi:hypothetical protein